MFNKKKIKMKKEPMTVTIDRDVMIALEEKMEAKKCSRSFITNELLRSSLKIPENPNHEILTRVANIALMSPSAASKYYNRSRTAIEFWKSVLSSRVSAKISKDLNKHYFVKFPKQEGNIQLPETGNMLKDIEEGAKNIENSLRVIHDVIPVKPTLEEAKKDFFNKLDEKGLMPDGNPLAKNKKSTLNKNEKSSLHSQNKRRTIK